jgi:hypothetical protein
METADYQPLVQAGAKAWWFYQETYDPTVYHEMHTSGPKRNFEWRLATPERAYAAVFGGLALARSIRSGRLAVRSHLPGRTRRTFYAHCVGKPG